jgi:hypothetical protein
MFMPAARWPLPILVVLLLAACGSSATTFVPFESDVGGYRVSLPPSPNYQSQQVPTPFGAVTMHVYSAEGGGVGFGVNHQRLPDEMLVGMRQRGADEVYDAGRDGMLRQLGAQARSERAVDAPSPGGTVTGREFTAMNPAGDTKFVVRVFWHQDKVYQVMATLPAVASQAQSDSAKQFLDSFTLL